MYPRRRISLMPIIVFAAIAFVAWLPALSSMHLEAATPQRIATVVVEPGDTVWSIASAHAHGGELGELVDRIVDANHLVDAQVSPGQKLRVPE